jgi:hypothetical protein
MFIKSFAVALCAAVLSLASLAWATSGTPISGTSVGLDHEPEGIAIPGGTTDAKGKATFAKLAAGRYTVFVPDLSKFKGSVVIAVSVGGAAPINSEPLKAAKGKGYALDKNGRKLVFTVEKAGTPLAVTIFDRWGN